MLIWGCEKPNKSIDILTFTGSEQCLVMGFLQYYGALRPSFFSRYTPLRHCPLLELFQEVYLLFQGAAQQSLFDFLKKIKLYDHINSTGKDKNAKREQILSYLEVIHTQIRKYSKQRELTFIDCGAGNCYLSFLLNYYYTHVDKRRVRMHCIDSNTRLMEKNKHIAEELGFDNMTFHGCDISEYEYHGKPDIVYSLHACDSATDKMLFLGIQTHARNILSVSCCQQKLLRQMKSKPNTGLTRHRVFKEKLAYMMGDSLRALLLEIHNYDVDIIEFVSSRATDKNTMIRAKKGQTHNPERVKEEFQKLKQLSRITLDLESYISRSNAETLSQDACMV